MIVILSGGQKLVHFEVERHEPFIASLIEAERVFWEGVVAGTPPAVDSHPATSDVIKRLYPKSNGKTITLDHDHIRKLARDLTDTKTQGG